MMKFLVAPGMTPTDAYTTAVANGCGGYYLTVPPVWQDQAVSEGWTYPCVVTMTDDGLVGSWEPV